MDYWSVNPDTLEDVVTNVDEFQAYKGDSLRKYFEDLMENAWNLDCTLVVFKARDHWQHVFISNQYNVPFVMKQLERRLSD